ncbi:hypothetical protein DFS34DRAFT_647207 [Phlyctochytrium arcticum]|nr:hypothetical protein DFS34DRAFT_647207 [Phlyctochytrium arcticum]
MKTPKRIRRFTLPGFRVSIASVPVTSLQAVTIQSASASIGGASAKTKSTQEGSQVLTSASTSSGSTSVCNKSGVEPFDHLQGPSGGGMAGSECMDDGGSGMEEVLGTARLQSENLEDVRITERTERLFRHRRDTRITGCSDLAPGTLREYARCRKRFLAWCTKQNFADGCWVRADKTTAFCQDELLAKGYYPSNCTTGLPTSYSFASVAQHIKACMDLYYEQVQEGLHNYPNPRSCPNLGKLLKILKRPKNDTRLSNLRDPGSSGVFGGQVQNGLDSHGNYCDGNSGSSAVGLEDPPVMSIPGMSELTDKIAALHNATMARIDGIENTLSSLQPSISTARSNDEIMRTLNSSQAPLNHPTYSAQHLVTLFDALWQGMESSSGSHYQRMKELGQVTRTVILSWTSTENSVNTQLQGSSEELLSTLRPVSNTFAASNPFGLWLSGFTAGPTTDATINAANIIPPSPRPLRLRSPTLTRQFIPPSTPLTLQIRLQILADN